MDIPNDSDANDATPLSPEFSSAFFRYAHKTLMHEMGINTEELGVLLGDIPQQNMMHYINAANSHTDVELEQDVYQRQSLLLSIYKAVKESSPSRNSAVKHFFTVATDYDLFKGLSLKDYLLENCSIQDLYEIRNFYKGRL